MSDSAGDSLTKIGRFVSARASAMTARSAVGSAPNSVPPARTIGDSFARSPIFPSHRFMMPGSEPGATLYMRISKIGPTVPGVISGMKGKGVMSCTSWLRMNSLILGGQFGSFTASARMRVRSVRSA